MEYERADRHNRFAIIVRESRKCFLCGDAGIDVHEIIPRSELTDIAILFSEKNRVLLCRECHTNNTDRTLLLNKMREKYGYNYSQEPFNKYITTGECENNV